jgi:hypothetical protein
MNNVTIVGKGPSLDNLKAEDFPDGPIICLNESITKIEALLYGRSDIYSMQQDGNPRCMRRPSFATVLLSHDQSAGWFVDYPRREIYNQSTLGLTPKIHSALSAIEYARQRLGATELTLMCFDALVTGEAGYPESIGDLYYHPANSERFKRFGYTILMQLKGLAAKAVSPGSGSKDFKSGPFTVITVTGDRKEAFKLCRQFVCGQTLLPSQWIVVDDGSEPMAWTDYCGAEYYRREPKANDPKHTLPPNLLVALEAVKYPKVLIMEDDDWYRKDYCEETLAMLDSVQLHGWGDSVYYYVTKRLIKRFGNREHSGFWSTAWNGEEVTAYVKKLCQTANDPLIDMQLWKAPFKKWVSVYAEPITIGIKGLPGRPGQTSGWRPEDTGYILDPGGLWFKSKVGDAYAGFFGTQPTPSSCVPTAIGGQRVRKLADGGFALMRSSREAEAELDRLLVRDVSNRLRWYPRGLVAKELAALHDLLKGKRCHIVGKGPSLDILKPSSFNASDVIICINESVKTVEALNLATPLIGIQQDVQLQNACMPTNPKTLMLLHENLRHWYATWANKIFYTRADVGVTTGTLTVVHAIKLAQRFGVRQLIFHAFDSLKGDYNYAKSVGYASSLKGSPNRFATHGNIIKSTIGDTPHRFV